MDSSQQSACILHEFSQWKNERDGVCVSPKEANCRHTNTYTHAHRHKAMQDERLESSLVHQSTQEDQRTESREEIKEL